MPLADIGIEPRLTYSDSRADIWQRARGMEKHGRRRHPLNLNTMYLASTRPKAHMAAITKFAEVIRP
ncbi:MAG: hypothetical protein IPK53_19545 [bacterium]|nr:hypothetical protein [bacterium]